MIFIGIDPGATGSVSIISEDGGLHVYPTPYNDKAFNISEMDSLVTCSGDKVFCVIEAAHAMPGQGVCSMFNYGKGYGFWLAILELRKISHELVHPRTWTRIMLAGAPGEGKERAYSVARGLFPAWNPKLMKEHPFADSILLAEYARRKYSGAI